MVECRFFGILRIGILLLLLLLEALDYVCTSVLRWFGQLQLLLRVRGRIGCSSFDFGCLGVRSRRCPNSLFL